MISTLPGAEDRWKARRMDLARSVEPSSEGISFQFLKVFCSSQAVRKRSPLSVQGRIVTVGAERRRSPPASVVGKTSAFACSDISDMPHEPQSLEVARGKST